VVFFSDAVFAIAATLLVVNLRVPPVTGPYGGAAVARALRQEIPRIATWVLSFYVIGTYWLGHHGMFRWIGALDRRMIRLNLLFLAVIAFLPFPTEVLSIYGDTVPALVLYAASMGLIGAVQVGMWFYAVARRLAVPGVGRPLALAYGASIARAPVLFVASIPLALVAGPSVAERSWALVIVTGPLLRRRVNRLAAAMPHDPAA
jgi:uncharacterized membrane protein